MGRLRKARQDGPARLEDLTKRLLAIGLAAALAACTTAGQGPGSSGASGSASPAGSAAAQSPAAQTPAGGGGTTGVSGSPTARPTATSAGRCLDLARRLPPPDFIEVTYQEFAPGCLITGRTAMSLDQLDGLFSERLSTVGMVIKKKSRLDQNTPGFPKLQFIFGGPGAVEGSSITASTEAYGVGVAITILTGGG